MRLYTTIRYALMACLTATPLFAQVDSTVSRRATLLQQLQQGSTLRVFTAGTTFTGPLRQVTRDSVLIDGRAFALHELSRIQVRARGTRTGVRWGAVVGGVGGMLAGGFLGYLIEALCESECSHKVSSGLVIGAAAGAVSGTVAGGVAGGIIGAATPKWLDLEAVRPRAARAANTTIGSFTLAPAYAHPGSGPGGGFGARASYTYQTKHFALGPEFAAYSLGSNTRARAFVCTQSFPESCTDSIPTQEIVGQGGLNARIGTGVEQRVEPYLTLGGGFYTWSRNHYLGSTQLVGYSAGAGVLLRNATRRRAIVTEVRWQDHLSHADNPNARYGFYTIAVGAQLAW